MVDDINDSGKTLKIIYDLNNPSKIIYNATLIYNQESKVKTHFYGKMIKRSEDKNWYVFPWEEWWNFKFLWLLKTQKFLFI